MESEARASEIWMAEIKKDALVAFDALVETWGAKYDEAVEWLIEDRDALLAFYDFPARALEASAHDQRHRKLVRDCASPHRALEWVSLETRPRSP